eukprot:332638_1
MTGIDDREISKTTNNCLEIDIFQDLPSQQTLIDTFERSIIENQSNKLNLYQWPTYHHISSQTISTMAPPLPPDDNHDIENKKKDIFEEEKFYEKEIKKK